MKVEVVRRMGASFKYSRLCSAQCGPADDQRRSARSFPMKAAEIAAYVDKFVEAGANVIGGCCGTTPEYIRMVKEKAVGLPPMSGRDRPARTLVSSLAGFARLGGNYPFMLHWRADESFGTKEAQ